MEKFAWIILTAIAAAPAQARAIKPACGILPTWETCVSEAVLVGEERKTFSGTGTDCEAGQALPDLISALQKAGVEPKGIAATCTYEQVGQDIRSWELTL